MRKVVWLSLYALTGIAVIIYDGFVNKPLREQKLERKLAMVAKDKERGRKLDGKYQPTPPEWVYDLNNQSSEP